MDVFSGRAEVDPYGDGTRGARMRFDLAYLAAWLFIGWTLARDGLARPAEHRQRTH